nr:anti-sigma factor [Pontibacter liquoris]
MEAYANLYAVPPRAALKDRVMQHIDSSAHAETPVRALYPEDRKEAGAFKWLFVASIVLVLLSGFLCFHFYTKWQQAEERLAGAIASEQQLAQNFERTSLQLQNQEEILSVLRNPEFKSVRLEGVESHAGASMMVYWNARQQKVFVDEVRLPAPPPGKQYQLWALQDGQPIDAGLIAISDAKASMQQMKKISAAEAFAVTLEPVGGSKTPTLEQLTVMGKITS